MNVLDRIYIKYKHLLCEISVYANCTKHIVYIANTKFQWRTYRHINIKNFRKESNRKKFKKRIHFVYSKRHNLQRDTSFRGVYFLRLGMAIFRVILRDSAQILVKKTTIYKHDMTQFAFIFSTKIKYEEWRECDMKKNICYFLLRLL